MTQDTRTKQMQNGRTDVLKSLSTLDNAGTGPMQREFHAAGRETKLRYTSAFIPGRGRSTLTNAGLW